ncbi:hypothetical protein [Kordia sp.]|uniref:hypothetical protein n=1 Tax=Kordia sp. TaxID=1965332 RepID=UPI003D6B010D
MKYLFLLLFPFLLNAQTNDLSKLASLEENEQVTIDISIGGCFGATTNAKILIKKLDKVYEFVYIENIVETLSKIDVKLLLYKEKKEKWLKENLHVLAKYGKKSILSEENYQAKIKLLRLIIKSFDDCKRKMSGEFSIIKINSTSIQYHKFFTCHIMLLDFLDF